MIVAEVAFAVLVLAASAYLFTLGVRALRERVRVARWPCVEGRVVGHSIHSRPKHHRPQFLVEYRVGNRTLKTLCESPTRAGYSADLAAKKRLEDYPVGSKVLLYVDPNRPERAYLWLPELFVAAAMILGALLFAGAVVAGFR